MICIHPDPRKESKPVRVQVKSRYQTDCDRTVPVKEKTFAAFDYLIVVFLNIGYFYRKADLKAGVREPEFYTLPRSLVTACHKAVASGFDRVHTRGLDLSAYKNEVGFELIAKDLDIPYPSRMPHGRCGRGEAMQRSR